MRNTSRVKDFIKKWSNSPPSKELVLDYIPICKNLLYEEEDDVVDVIHILRNNISLWARDYCKVYAEIPAIISKIDLQQKSDWYVEQIQNESQKMSSSGSITGIPFFYLRWDSLLYPIECENHYDLILDEFKIQQNPNILYFFPNIHTKTEIISVFKDSTNFMEHHGRKRKTTVHYVNFNFFKENQDEFFTFLLDYLSHNEIDVFFTAGPQINSLCHHMKKRNFSGKIANLISNTGERLLQADATFLKKYVDNICDHMRCWDGGATFFTCCKGNYHLLDNLSWCEIIDRKLISTDYFSLPSPFVNYWNGDYAKIDKDYQRCLCGRLYRKFEFLENRPFSIKGTSILDLKNDLKKLKLPIKQVRCHLDCLHVVISKEIEESDKLNIKEILKKFEVKFIVE